MWKTKEKDCKNCKILEKGYRKNYKSHYVMTKSWKAEKKTQIWVEARVKRVDKATTAAIDAT